MLIGKTKTADSINVKGKEAMKNLMDKLKIKDEVLNAYAIIMWNQSRAEKPLTESEIFIELGIDCYIRGWKSVENIKVDEFSQYDIDTAKRHADDVYCDGSNWTTDMDDVIKYGTILYEGGKEDYFNYLQEKIDEISKKVFKDTVIDEESKKEIKEDSLESLSHYDIQSLIEEMNKRGYIVTKDTSEEKETLIGAIFSMLNLRLSPYEFGEKYGLNSEFEKIWGWGNGLTIYNNELCKDVRVPGMVGWEEPTPLKKLGLSELKHILNCLKEYNDK